VTLLHGTVLLDYNEIDTGVAMKELEKMRFIKEGQKYSDADRDQFYMRSAFAFMRENPTRMLKQWLSKFANFWRFYPRTDKAYHESIQPSRRRPWPRRIGRHQPVFEPWLILLGLIGLWR